MFKLSLRNLLAHKGRFLMTVFAVVLGVGFVVASSVVTDTLRTSIDGLFAAINDGVDLSVRAESNLDSGGGGGPTSRGRVPEGLLDDVLEVEGVDAAEGVVGGYAQMLDEDGEPVTSTGSPFLGVSWGEEDQLYPVTLDEGKKPSGPGEVAIDRDTSSEFGLDVGDRSTVLLVDGPRDVEVVGVFTFGETNSLLGARLTAFEAAVAQEAFGAAGEFDTIDVAADGDVDPADLAASVQTILPAGFEAITSEQIVDEAIEETGQFIGIFQTVLLAFAGVALIVSAFFINNTFAIVLGQRTRELALLRGVGASGSQIRRSVALESLVIGLLASAIGVGVGLVIAVLLQAILAAGGFELPEEGLVLAARSWVLALIVGVGVTVLSSIAPARRASRIQPVEGMREGYRAPTGGTRRTIAGLALTFGGVALMALGLFVFEGGGAVFGSLGIGAIAVLLGVSMLSPLISVPVARVIGAPFARLGISGRIARQNVIRTPSRTARTASALMIGLALVTTVLVVGTSIKAKIAGAVEETVRADFVISAEGFTGFSPAVVAGVTELDEVTAASGIRFDRFRFEDTEEDLVAVDPDAAARLVDIAVADGAVEGLQRGEIVVHEDSAGDAGVSVGDEVTVEFAMGGAQQFTVAAIHRDATFAGNFLIGIDDFSEFYPANDVDFIAFVRLADGVDLDDGRAAIETVLEEYPQLTLEDRSEYGQSQEDELNQLLVAVNALLGLALFIALMGIANTLALSVIERTREIGLLRAVGMSRRQARRMVLVEAIVVSVFGALLGVAVGLLFGIGSSLALPDSFVDTIVVPWGSLLVVVIAAAICGILAGLLPARRAARLDVLDALASE